MTQAENNRRNGRLNKDEVITAENIRRRGEYTAIKAVKGKLALDGSGYMQRTYYNLIKDMDNFERQGYVLTDSYEIAQEAIMFLCGYIGRKLTDTITDRKGEQITILWACFRHVSAYLSRNIRKRNNYVQMDDLSKHQIAVPFEWEIAEEREDYAAVNEIIKQMNLTERQTEVLECKMDNRTQEQTACALSLARTTIRDSLKYIKIKYFKTFESLPQNFGLKSAITAATN